MRIVAYRYREVDGSTSPPLDALGEEMLAAVERVYTDVALPTEPGYRPERDRLLADLQAHPADRVLVDSLATLGNDPDDIRYWVQAFESVGVEVVTLTDDAIDLDSILQGADLANDQRRRRLREGHARSRLQALPPPGKPPYGYRRGQGRYLIDRATAPVVTAFVNEFLLYGSLRGAVRFIEGKLGKRISVSTGRRWLTHPVYRGDLQYRDGNVLRDTHAAIISRDEAAQIDRLLRRNRPLPPRTAGAPRSLAGLVTCQSCSQPLTISKTAPRGQAKSYLYLRPSGCPKAPRCPAIPYDDALHRIVNQICQELPPAVAQFTAKIPPGASTPSVDLQGAIAAKEAAIAQLPTLEESGILDAETVALRRYKLKGEISTLHQQLAQLPPVNLQELSQSVSIPQFWLDLSEAERRFFFREFIRDIQIVREDKDWWIELVLVF
ncbi:MULTISPECIES: recombinase family protein [Cyanophyceae]|uniref:recombinase family protein n=1 Tax=Cyanophyceae TaxID=3028117 RepID=UPI00168502DE|nr:MULTISPECIES: recombinase family protein [Cyanophyceae]MBD1915672.1 recombinase family protein [Phormidium sp. FACHB-77]MBD2029306.1 recombinase family protein [Phormidium sp. FACHB-322]MBD2049296.1 recombinase family protein [Leptolyngbya sp. FACHB-60]